MSWFSIFGGSVIFGGLRLCDTSLDWRFACNIGGPFSGSPTYCSSFPDSTCTFSPSQVFSSFECDTSSANPSTFFNGCSGNEKYSMDYKFRQAKFTEGPAVNVSIVSTFNCEQVVMEHNGTGLFVTVQDNVSKPGCPGFVASSSSTSSTSSTSNTSTTELSSSATSVMFSNSTTSLSVLNSTILTTRTYTITSCPPTVTNCPVGSVTTDVVTTFTTYCPATVAPTATPSPSFSHYTSAPTSTNNSSNSSAPIRTISTIPSPSLSPIQVSVGSSLRIPWILVWFSSAVLLFSSVPSVLATPENESIHPVNLARDANTLHSLPSSNLAKRIPVADFAEIKSFGSTLSATMELNLPTIPGKSSSLLQSRMIQVTNDICQAGKQNKSLYGSNWATTTNLKLLGHMLADCAKSMDQMDQDLLSFYTQEEINAGPEGVLFLKFAGIAYCNRLIVPLVDDPASLDGICGLVG